MRIPSLEMVTPGHTQHTHPLVLWEIEQDEINCVSETENFRPRGGRAQLLDVHSCRTCTVGGRAQLQDVRS